MKKQTNWITISEDIKPNSTTDSGSKKSSRLVGESPVKNKVFWGAAFIVLVFATFALLAPNQFSTLLKGNLFDTSGLSKDDMAIGLKTLGGSKDDSSSNGSIDSILTDSTATDSTSTDTTDSTATDSISTDIVAPTSTDSTVVEAEDEAVAISIDPIVTTTEPEDCEGLDCFLGNLEDCTLSTVEFSFEVMNQAFKTDLEITGEEDDSCKVLAEFTESPVPTLVGEEMELAIEKGIYTEDDLVELFSNKDELAKIINGSIPEEYINLISKVITPISAEDIEDIVNAVTGETSDSQAKLIEDLKRQIDNLTKQRQEDVKTIQDIADTVIDQATDTATHAAATTTGATTGTTATSAIGQPSQLVPGFKANPYTVSVTPQQMLQKNLGAGTTYTTASTTTYQPTYQQTVQASVITGTTTPETGPSEVLLMAFVITFLGLVGWRFVRTFA